MYFIIALFFWMTREQTWTAQYALGGCWVRWHTGVGLHCNVNNRLKDFLNPLAGFRPNPALQQKCSLSLLFSPRPPVVQLRRSAAAVATDVAGDWKVEPSSSFQSLRSVPCCGCQSRLSGIWHQREHSKLDNKRYCGALMNRFFCPVLMFAEIIVFISSRLHVSTSLSEPKGHHGRAGWPSLHHPGHQDCLSEDPAHLWRPLCLGHERKCFLKMCSTN